MKDMRRTRGQVPTPPELVARMVALARPWAKGLSVLEPGCGSCPFLRAFREAYGEGFRLVGVERFPEALDPPPFAEVHLADFLDPGQPAGLFGQPRVSSEGAILGGYLGQPQRGYLEGGPFHLILANPPYGAPGAGIGLSAGERRAYRKRFATWYGRYNLYGAFLEQGVRLLAPGGVLVYVVPAGWMFLDEFSRLRRFLAQEGALEVFYLGRAFPGLKVRATVLRFTKGGRGLKLYQGFEEEVWADPGWQGGMVRFPGQPAGYLGQPAGYLEALAMEQEGIPLSELFEIRFAARSPELKRHPLTRTVPGPGLVPVLTGRNLKPGYIDYETPHSGLFFPKEKAALLKPFYALPHLVVAHTRHAKVVAAFDERAYPWREEFHLLPKGVSIKRMGALVEYLNGPEVQGYYQGLYRDAVPHLTRSMLARLPIPRDLL